MQVYIENKLVGRLGIEPRPGARDHIFRVLDDLDAPALPSPGAWVDPYDDVPEVKVSFRTLRLEIASRGLEISRMDLYRDSNVLHEVLKTYSIPANYERFENFEKDTISIRWKVFVATPDVYDDLFDMDAFEPDSAGGEPDLEHHERRKAEILGAF